MLPWVELQVRLGVWRTAMLGTAAAAVIGVLTYANPGAAPAHGAVGLRVAIIVTLIVAGIYAQTRYAQARMGAVLVGAGLFSAVWLLNGSSVPVLFAIGVLASGAAPPTFCYLMLAYPSGHLRARWEGRFLLLTGIVAAVPWTLVYLTSVQPSMRAPLLSCAPHCQANPFFLGSTSFDLDGLGLVVGQAAWMFIAAGTAIILLGRLRRVPTPARRSLIPVGLAAILYAGGVLAFSVARRADSGTAELLGALTVLTVLLVPLAMFVGFAIERLFMGQALAMFVNQLVGSADVDPETVMATALDDPSLRIAYRRTTTGTYVDSHGETLALPDQDNDRALAWIRRDGTPVAAVVFDSSLSGQLRFIEAAGAVAMLRLEHAELDAEVAASARELAASRTRILEAADGERQRIERDLHDGIQQHLVGLRLKLHLASEAVHDEPDRGEQLLAALGDQMEVVLDELRSLARGVYPEILSDHGVGQALKSVARLGPVPVTVRTAGTGRYPASVEIAVYFCCLEALQNVAKHAGLYAEAYVTLWEIDDGLQFEVRDTGCGFQLRERRWAHGLVHMRDRIEAVGGTLTVSSSRGHGTLIRGEVPSRSWGLEPRAVARSG